MKAKHFSLYSGDEETVPLIPSVTRVVCQTKSQSRILVAYLVGHFQRMSYRNQGDLKGDFAPHVPSPDEQGFLVLNDAGSILEVSLICEFSSDQSSDIFNCPCLMPF